MAIRIDVEVAYGQLAIFAGSLPQPFNDWSDRHVSQGFAWRPGSVSFRTLVEAGRHSVEIKLADHAGLISPEAVRVVEVPFEVPADGAIEIGSISETVSLSFEAGLYLLRCEFLAPASGTQHEERVCLTFSRQNLPRFAVVLADAELSIDGELLTSAQPAFG
ncbi:MAG TPA: competence protein ComJ [Burkholderiaceae bacterium]